MLGDIMKHIPQKVIITVIVLLVMLFGTLMIIGAYDIYYHSGKDIVRRQNQLDMLALWIPELENEEINSTIWFEENIGNNVRIMQEALKELVEKGVYTGPRIFDDGVVVEIQDGQIVYPEELPVSPYHLVRRI